MIFVALFFGLTALGLLFTAWSLGQWNEQLMDVPPWINEGWRGSR